MAKVWLQRWGNGDVSIVWGADRLEAAEMLDEVGGSDPEELITAGPRGAVHLYLGDDGELEFESLAEQTEERIVELYPAIEAAELLAAERHPISRPTDAEMAQAVKEERERLWGVQGPDEADNPEDRASGALLKRTKGRGPAGPLLEPPGTRHKAPRRQLKHKHSRGEHG